MTEEPPKMALWGGPNDGERVEMTFPESGPPEEYLPAGAKGGRYVRRVSTYALSHHTSDVHYRWVQT